MGDGKAQGLSIAMQSGGSAEDGPGGISKEDLLRSLTELRIFFKELAEAMHLAWDANLQSGRMGEILAAHRRTAHSENSLFSQSSKIAALFRYFMGKISQDSLVFHLPHRGKELSVTENDQLAQISTLLKDLNDAVENQIGHLYSAGHNDQFPIGSRSHLLLRPIVSLFKSVIRQDWGDVELMMDHINIVTTSRHSHELSEQVGRLIRGIYVGLTEISQEIPLKSLHDATDAIPDATETLQRVIQELEDGANRNLDLLENLSVYVEEDKKRAQKAAAVLAECDQELAAMVSDFPALAGELEAVRTTLREKASDQIKEIENDLQENHDRYMILFANQSYQDLTGQTLKKVIAFIETLQYQLIQVIVRGKDGSMASRGPSGMLKGEEMVGPDAINRLSQDKVDDLLGELGF